MQSRPKSLAELAQHVSEGADFRFELGDFLDGFYQNPNAEALIEEPVFLFGTDQVHGERRDAFLAATAEFLAVKFNLTAPGWAFQEQRTLENPYFDFKTRSGQLFLLKDSPAAFKSRRLFVTSAVLDRV